MSEKAELKWPGVILFRLNNFSSRRILVGKKMNSEHKKHFYYASPVFFLNICRQNTNFAPLAFAYLRTSQRRRRGHFLLPPIFPSMAVSWWVDPTRRDRGPSQAATNKNNRSCSNTCTEMVMKQEQEQEEVVVLYQSMTCPLCRN